MKEKIELNSKLKNWIFGMINDLIVGTIEDSPDRVSTIVAVNCFLEKLGDVQELEINRIVGETIVNKMFEEIKNNI